jgi:hypothetical protein
MFGKIINYVTHYHTDFSVLTVYFLSCSNIHFCTLFSSYVPEYMTTVFPYVKRVLYNMTFEVRKVVLLRIQVI